MREVLGKKLSKGTKKDLDDISTKTGITLKSCRRQVGTASCPQHKIPCPVCPFTPSFWSLPQLHSPPPPRIVAAASYPVSCPFFCSSKASPTPLLELLFQKLRSDHSFPLLINFNWLSHSILDSSHTPWP